MHPFTDSYTLLFLSPVRIHFEGNLLFSDEKESKKAAISFAHFFRKKKKIKNGWIIEAIMKELNPPFGKVVPEGVRVLRGCHNNPWTLCLQHNFHSSSGAN